MYVNLINIRTPEIPLGKCHVPSYVYICKLLNTGLIPLFTKFLQVLCKELSMISM